MMKEIKYPITVNDIELKSLEPWNPLGRPPGTPVSVRPVDDDKTYLGFYLGDFPYMSMVRYDRTTGVLTFNAAANPCIFIPELNRTVFGAECWWQILKNTDELKAITDETIKSQWYVQMANAMFETKYETKESEVSE